MTLLIIFNYKNRNFYELYYVVKKKEILVVSNFQNILHLYTYILFFLDY